MHVVSVASEAAVFPCEVDGVAFGVAESADFGHVNVADAVLFEAGWEGFFVELGVMSATRNCAHIHEQGYAVDFEKLDEFFECSGGVPNC